MHVDWNWFNDFGHLLLCLMVIKAFLDNMAKELPNVAGDTVFKVLCGILNAVIATANPQRKYQPEEPAPDLMKAQIDQAMKGGQQC